MGTICRGHRDIGNSRKHVQREPVLGREPDYCKASGWTWRGAQCLGFSLRPKVRVPEEPTNQYLQGFLSIVGSCRGG